MTNESRKIQEWLIDLRDRQQMRQDEVDKKSRDLGARISQSYLSQLERGIKPLASLGGERMDVLRRIYAVSPEEWVARTGISIATPTTAPTPQPPSHAERRGWVIPDEDPEPEIPEALQEAADRYGHGPNAPLSEPRWLRELADLDFREEPETPEDWLAVYARLSKIINPK